MFPLESTFRRFPYFLSTTTPLRNRRKESALGSPFAEAAGVLAGPGLTVWGSWGRRCSAAAHEGTRRTPACLGSSGSPDSRIRETCTLQKNTDVVRSDPSAALHFWACLRTRHGVVHVEAVAFDVFQIHASVHKHAERKEELWKICSSLCSRGGARDVIAQLSTAGCVRSPSSPVWLCSELCTAAQIKAFSAGARTD